MNKMDDMYKSQKKWLGLDRVSIYFIKGYILTFLILVLLAIIIFNYSYLSGLLGGFFEDQIQIWGYFGVSISSFILELIPQPFLSALVPFTTGLLLKLDFQYLFFTMLISSIIANYIAYFFGKYYGDSIALFLVSKESYEKSLNWFGKYGKKSITFLALTPIPYFPVMGGIFKMTLREFTVYAIIPRIFHFIIFAHLILLFF